MLGLDSPNNAGTECEALRIQPQGSDVYMLALCLQPVQKEGGRGEQDKNPFGRTTQLLESFLKQFLKVITTVMPSLRLLASLERIRCSN